MIMKWQQTRDDIWICNTPLGKLKIEQDFGGYHLYLHGEHILRNKDLETAKEEAKIHLLKTYYSLKIYLEINE